MRLQDPQYDCLFLHTRDDVDKARKWLDRMEERLDKEIEALSAVERSFRRPLPPDEEPEDAVFVGLFHTTDLDAIPNMTLTVERVKEQREHMREAVRRAKTRLDLLQERVEEGVPAVFVLESIWYAFGYEYLYEGSDVDYNVHFGLTLGPYRWWSPLWFPLWPFFW